MPISIVARVVGMDEAIGLINSYPQRKVQVTANRFNQLGQGLVPIMKRHTPVGASGELRNSTTHVVHIQDLEVELNITQPAINYYDGQVYQDWVTSGRLPGRRPPLEALKDWVAVNWIPISRTDAQELVWVLANKIAEKGTQRSYYVIDALDESQELINRTALQLQQDLEIILWQEHI